MHLTPLTLAINAMLPSLLAMVPDDVMERALDGMFDAITDAVKASDTRLDDATVLPIIAAVRAKFEVPHFDQEGDRV